MEAWLEGTPAVVAAGSDVLREHCERSGGGLPLPRTTSTRGRGRQAVRARLRRKWGRPGATTSSKPTAGPAVRRRFREAIEILTE